MASYVSLDWYAAVEAAASALSSASFFWKASSAAFLASSSSISAIISAAVLVAEALASSADSFDVNIICWGSSSIETINSEQGMVKSIINSLTVAISEELPVIVSFNKKVSKPVLASWWKVNFCVSTSYESTMAWTPLELVITSPSVKKLPPDTIINEDIVLTSNELLSDSSEQGLYSSIKTSSKASNNNESLSLPPENTFNANNGSHNNLINCLKKVSFID